MRFPTFLSDEAICELYVDDDDNNDDDDDEDEDEVVARRCRLPETRYLWRLSEQASDSLSSNALVHEIFTNCSLSFSLVPTRTALLFSPPRQLSSSSYSISFLSFASSLLTTRYVHRFQPRRRIPDKLGAKPLQSANKI
ncbi:hypothetical protein ACLKA6_004281 [Drosophila palustris]